MMIILYTPSNRKNFAKNDLATTMKSLKISISFDWPIILESTQWVVELFEKDSSKYGALCSRKLLLITKNFDNQGNSKEMFQ